MMAEVSRADNLRIILCLNFARAASREAVEKLKGELLDCECVVSSFEATGAFDFLIEAELRDFAEYHALLDAFSSEMATLVERQEVSFVYRHLKRVSNNDQALWVPCRDGRRRVECRAIDLVRADGDYVRIQSGLESWMIHDTMYHMREILDPTIFLTLHRSTIVNAHFIHRLAHSQNRWAAVLADGTEYRIAKSHVAATLASLQAPVPAADVHRPFDGPSSGNSLLPTE